MLTLRLHFFVTQFLTWNLILPGMLCILISIFYHLDIYSIEEIAIEMLFGSFLPLATVVDTIVLIFGRDIVAVYNFCIPLAFRLNFQEKFNDNTNFFEALHIETRKIYLCQNVDWFAIIASNNLISGTILSIIIPLALTYQNIDHFYLILKGISSQKLINGPDLTELVFVKVFRYWWIKCYSSIASINDFYRKCKCICVQSV